MRVEMSLAAVSLALAACVPAVSASGRRVVRADRATLAAVPAVLTLTRTGVYRVTGADLLKHGISLLGVTGAALSARGARGPISLWVSTMGPLGPGSAIEFYAQADHSRYGPRTDLLLSANRGAPRFRRDTAPRGTGQRWEPRLSSPQTEVAPAAAIPGTFTEPRRAVYAPNAPGSHWFFRALVSSGTAVSIADRFALPDLVSRGTARIVLPVWPVSDLPGSGPQHHVVLRVNGMQVAGVRFSSSARRTITASFPAARLRRLINVVTVTLPGDVRNRYHLDAVDVQTVIVAYPRRATAPSGRLTFTLPTSRQVTIGRLPAGDIALWQIPPVGDTAHIAHLTVTHTQRNRQVRFAGTAGDRYVLAVGPGFLHPDSIVPLPNTSSVDRPAAMEILAPRAFLSTLRPLARYHAAHGIPTRLSAIEDVELRHGWGQNSPAAIRSWLGKVHPGYLLIVGADTVDYRHFLRCTPERCSANPTDRSFVPSLYAHDPAFGEIPSDELLVAGQDGEPSVAVGRVPATSIAEVRLFVQRTLAAVHRVTGAPRAVLATGGGDPTFPAATTAIRAELPAQYATTTIGSTGGAASRHARLLHALNADPRIVDFVGHGNLEQWGTSPPVLSIADVPRLTNQPPAQFYGWGCQTAYDVDPTDRPLNARLLFSQTGGAVLTIGSTGLDQPQPQALLAQAFIHELFHDPQVLTVGQALRTAETQVLSADAGALDTVHSYELFGDPALPDAPLQ